MSRRWIWRLLLPLLCLYVVYCCVVFFPPDCQKVIRVVRHPRNLQPLQNTTGALSMCKMPDDDQTIDPQDVDSWANDGIKLRDVKNGGAWKPLDCTAKQRVAIIIPFRKRESHLRHLLATLHQLLILQNIEYRVIVVEQAGEDEFNRGKLKNIGFLEAQKLEQFDCFIFHDVDLLPEKTNNFYLCDIYPRHLCPAINEMRYILPYKMIFGGVVALTGEQFRLANGYSNLYWGWGAEDDDLSARIQEVGMPRSQPPMHIGRYRMLRHTKDQPSPVKTDLFFTWQNRWKVDGLSDSKGLNYTVLKGNNLPLFTHILVDVGSPPNNLAIWMEGPRISKWWDYRFFHC